MHCVRLTAPLVWTASVPLMTVVRLPMSTLSVRSSLG